MGPFFKDEHTLVIFYDSRAKEQKLLINKIQTNRFTVVHDIQTNRGKVLHEMHHRGEELPVAYYSKWVVGDRVPFDLKRL